MTPRTTAQHDRAAGCLLGLAAGDALGAGYEFGPPLADDAPVDMIGGGAFAWERGEWTDDTSMAIPIARIAAEERGLEFGMDRVLEAWVDWARDAKDVGSQTRSILGNNPRTEAEARALAQQLHDRTGRSGGNGSLMRTASVALAYLDNPDALVEFADRFSTMTHWDTDAREACVLWCLAIRHAVLTGELDARVGLDRVSPVWADRLDEAEGKQPRDFENNGWVVQALQGAWSAITHGSSLVDVLERAVRGGRDTDTVAAIAGSLAGAAYGASAVPAKWRRILHGWPGIRARDLTRMGMQAIGGGSAWTREAHFDYSSWGDVTALARHPFDDGVWIGAIGSLPLVEVDAVVSLCRVGLDDVRVAPENHVEQMLVDQPGPEYNPNLDFVLADAADAVAAFRAEGKTVLLHCVQAQSRTPTVAALYAARHLGVRFDEALDAVKVALPRAHPKPFLVEAGRRIERNSSRAGR
jgi:ADP-ribosylglycohydrolase